MNFVSPLRQRFPFLGVLIAAICGILLASWLGPTVCLAVLLLAGLLVLYPLRRQGGFVWALTAIVFAILQLWQWNVAPARKMALWFDAHPQELAVQGVVVAEPKISVSGVASFPLQLEKIEALEDSKAVKSLLVLPIQVEVRWAGEKPQYGDLVNFQAVPSRPPSPRNPGAFDYQGWLERRGIFTEFNLDPAEPGRILSHGHGNPLMAWAIASRQRMEEILSTDLKGPVLGAPDVLSAIEGITLGETENAPSGFTDDFRFTGTMHLFAVSGLHVGMLAVIIWFGLNAARLPRSWAVGLMIPSLFFYVLVTGMKMGSIRSATMVSLLLCGTLLYRRAPLFNTLAASALLQLSLDTNTLFSAGWQFSYSVVFAILALVPPLEAHLSSVHSPDPFLPPVLLTRRERWRFSLWKHVSGLLAVSIAAWIGSLIPTVAYFHLISLSAIGANLLAVPLAFGVLSLGALSLLFGVLSPWVAGAFNNANWLVTKLLLLVVQGSALLPGSHWFVGPIAKPYPVATVFDLGGASCMALQNGSHFALVNAGRKRDAARVILPFLESRGANRLQSVLISKENASHLGGLLQIQREIPLKNLWLPFLADSSRSPVAREVIISSGKSAGQLHPGDHCLLVPGVDATMLPLVEAGKNARDAILIPCVSCGSIRILLLPRITPELAKQLADSLPEVLHAEVLVMPLGGDEIISTLQVIRKISPKVIISPVDEFARNGLPSHEWDDLLAAEKITLLRQDQTAAVIIEADPVHPQVKGFLTPQSPVPLGRQSAEDK